MWCCVVWIGNKLSLDITDENGEDNMEPKNVEERIDALWKEDIERDHEKEKKDVCKKWDAECFPEIVVFIAVEKVEKTTKDDASDKCCDKCDDNQYEWEEWIDSVRNTRAIDSASECLRKHAAGKEEDNEDQESDDNSYCQAKARLGKDLPARIIMWLIT